MKIVHVCSVHPAFDTRIFWRHCTSLAQAGYEVVFVAPHDKDEEREGVRIKAIKPAASRADRFRRARHEACEAALAEDAALYHLHSPDLLPLGPRLKSQGAKVVYDAHEDLPGQNAGRAWIPGPLRHPVGWYVDRVERRGAAALDAVCVAHDTIIDRFPKDRTIVLNNYPRLDMLPGPDEWPPYAERPPVAFHVGSSCNRVRGMPHMVEAMGLLPGDLDATLRVVGGIPAELEAEMRPTPGWARVDYRGSLPFHEMAQQMIAARVAILPFLAVAHHLTSYPNKLFEYMAAGLPVVATDMPHWRRHVGDVGCVRWVDPEQPQTMADAIADLIANPREAEEMGLRGRRAAEERFNWPSESMKLLELYERLLGPLEPGPGGDSSRT